MRRLALAALLSTTALCGPMAQPAAAGPIGAFIGGLLNAFGAGTWLASGFVGAWSAGFSVGSWLAGGSILSRLVLSVGLSALSQALMPTPNLPKPSDIMANYAQDLTFAEWIYGRVRKGGPFALSAFSRAAASVPGYSLPARGRRHYGVIIACHSTLGPVTHYLDKWEVEADGTGLVTTDPIDPYGRIRTYTGQPGQAVDPVWDAVFPEVTAAENFKGLSYAALTADRPPDSRFAETYPNGREWVYAPVWDGCDTVYDPRTETWGWSRNAALVIADIAIRIYGKTVDWDQVADEAEICDAPVTNRDGGTQPRWTVNTVIRANMTWEEARAHLQLCCDAFFYERRDGKLGFRVGAYSAPVITLTARDFLSLSVRHKATGPDKAGSYALRYVEPARDWNEEVTGAVVVGSTGARQEQECFGIDSHNQGWRVAVRWAATAQPEWAITGTLKFIGYECMEERFLRIQHEELGLDCVVEVGMLQRNAGSHTFQLDAVSVVAGDFAPDALTDEPPRTLRASIAEDGSVPAPASLSGEAVAGTGGTAMIEWSWPAQSSDLRQQLRVRSTDIGITDWQTIDIGADQSTYVMSGLADGAEYEAQVRNRTTAGRLSAWVPETPLTVEAVANTSPPPPVTGFGAVAAGSSANISWTAPNSGLYAAARIWRAAGASAPFSSATLIQTEFGAPNTADSYTDPAPGTGTHRYWIAAINASGVESTRSGPINVTIT